METFLDLVTALRTGRCQMCCTRNSKH